jgi:cobalt-zinc-cadmium resistance protein CzcA
MLEKLLNFSIKQRFLMIVASVVLVVVGYVSWTQLTLDAVPDITTNQVTVNTNTGGMGPQEVEKLVTFPVETTMAGLPGVKNVRSLSQYGLSQVVVTFQDDVDTYFARQLVNEKLASVREDLPDSVGAPEMGPVSTGLGEIYMYALESDTMDILDLRELQDWVIAPQLRTVPGVVAVNATDSNEKRYKIVLDVQKMRARGIGVDEVAGALEANNSNAGGGVIDRGDEQMTVRSVGWVQSEEDIASIVIKSTGGVPVLIGDIAAVEVGSLSKTGISTKDGQQAMVATILMLKGANGRTVALNADAKVNEIRDQLPEGVTLTTVYNRADLVNATVHTVQMNLIEGGILVVVVLLIFLGNFRSSLIVALVIPLSMLLAVIGMNKFGVSGNLMSLGAIDFGLIVDGAVVMVENTIRRLAMAREYAGRTLSREEVRETVWEASKEVAKPTAFAVTIITVVYLPLLSLQGTEGKMFTPMALTVVFALLGALALTLLLVPALCSMLLSGDTKEGKNVVMDTFSRAYTAALGFALKQRAIVVTGAAALVALSAFMFGRLGSEFIPQLDEGSLAIQSLRLRTVGPAETIKLVTAKERKVLEVPEVTTVFSRTGTPEIATDPMPLSLTDSFVMLKPRKEWREGLTKEDLVEEIEHKLKDVPGQGYGFTQPIQLRFDELTSGVKADLGIKVFGEDLDELRDVAEQVEAALMTVPGATDVSVEQVDEIPSLDIVVKRSALARYGVSAAAVQQWIQLALGSESIGQLIRGDRRFDIVLALPPDVRSDFTELERLPVSLPNGQTVPLSTLAELKVVAAPAQISRESGKRKVVVSANVRSRDLGTFVKDAKAAIGEQVDMPDGVYLAYGGQFENLERAANRLTIVVPVALAMIFVLLFLTFGSVKQSLLIFTGVPLAVTGGVIALAARDLPFSISAGVGFIALSGLAVLNGVVMVSAINNLRSEGLSVPDAVRQGATQRLRAVLMTALVAALGFIPMALNTGIGAEVQRPLATVVIGGIISATILTLLVLPILYILFEKDVPLQVD